MLTTGISPSTKTVLESIVDVDFVKRYYLAGGTACALYYGHRLSYDLDFFSRNPEEPQQITLKLKKIGKLNVQQESDGTWLGSLNGVKLSFFEHLYPEIGVEEKWMGVRIASKTDIACMKLEAIASRGIMRDFVDMYYLTREIGLEEIMSSLKQKYVGVDYSDFHFLRALTYFEDADKSVKPNMLEPLDWDGVKKYFESEVKRLSAKWGV